MPLVNITTSPAPGSITIQCFKCGKRSSVLLNQLQLGTFLSPDVIALPPCSCGGYEFFQRTFDTLAKDYCGGPFDLHRRGVNALAKLLKDAGKIAPEQQATIAAETKIPTDISEPDAVDLSAYLPAPKQE